MDKMYTDMKKNFMKIKPTAFEPKLYQEDAKLVTLGPSQSTKCFLITFRQMNDLVQKSFLFDPNKKNQLYANNSEQISLRVQL